MASMSFSFSPPTPTEPSSPFNSTENASDHFFEDYSSLHELIFQLNAAMNGLSVLATLLNIAILVILSLYSLKQSRTTSGARLISTTHLLISLASGDLLMAICSQIHSTFILIAIPSDHESLVYADARNLCTIRLLGAFENIAIPITLINLFLLALDHAVAVFRPLEYHLGRYQTPFSVLIALAWIGATLLGFLDLILVARKHEVTCQTIIEQQTIDHYIHITLVFIVLATNAFIYATILIYIRRVLNATYRTNVPNARSLRQRMKSLATTLLLLGTYVICWLPYHAIQLTEAFDIHIPHLDNPRTAFTLDFALHLFILINAILDPLIYAIRIKDVRASIRRILKCHPSQCCCRSRNALTVTFNVTINECQQTIDTPDHNPPLSTSISTAIIPDSSSFNYKNMRYSNSQFSDQFNDEDDEDDEEYEDYDDRSICSSDHQRHRVRGSRDRQIPIEMEMERFLSNNGVVASAGAATPATATAASGQSDSVDTLRQDAATGDGELINSDNTSQP